jgi:hypothetical protein
VALAQQLAGGVINVDGRVVVTSIDGSLHRVDQVLKSQSAKSQKPTP